MKQIALILLVLLCTTIAGFAQTTVRGKVTDSRDGTPLQGITVKAKGEKTSVVTAADGSFELKVSAAKSVEISSVGYFGQSLAIGDGNLSVKLEKDTKGLSEVVVTGYSTKLKRANTGSSSTVTIDDVRTQPIASFDQLLQGQAPGLNVKAGSGQPGRSADVVIRGKGSVNGSTSPLYVVDGIEVRGGDFSTMNQSDFESVTILKDAASTAIYGSRGANGVIVVTTKKGKSGKLKLSYDVQYGNSKLPKNQLKLMNTQEKLDFEQNPDLGNNPWGRSDEDFASLRSVNTNWDDYVFQKGKTISHQISASGGNEKTTFYTSASYLNQEGVVIETGLKRYTGRINIAHKENNIKIGANLSGGWSDFVGTAEGDQSVASPLNTVIWALPYEKPYTETGAYTLSIQDPFWLNPIEELKVNKDNSWQIKSTGNIYLEYNIPFIKNLTYRINAGGDYSQNEEYSVTKNGTQRAALTAPNPTRENGEISRSLDRRFRYTVTNNLNYKTILDQAGEHTLGVSLFTEFVKTKGRAFGFTGYGLLSPFDNEAAITQGTSENNFIPQIFGADRANSLSNFFPSNSALMSYFGSVDYGFKNRYFLTLTGRTDGSSRLAKAKRWTKYGSVAAAWVISDESFFKVPAINSLKLRVSYGSVGNQTGIGDFPYLQQYGGRTYGGVSTLQVTRLGNPDLTWEKRRTTNIGIDFALLKNRLTGTLEFYNSLTTDLYFSPFIPSTSGGSGTILGNSGSMENKGIDFSIGVRILDGKNLKWSIDANYSYNKNTIKSLPDGQDFQLSKSFQALKVGKPLNTFYLVEYLGVNPENGSSQFRDISTKGVTETYDPKNNQFLGTSDAPHNGGFTNTISYRGIELSAFVVFSRGNYIYNNARLNVENSGYVSSGFSRNALNAWTKPGQITNFPVLTETTESNTTRFLEKGDFWRLRNVMLSYSLPRKLLDRAKIQGFRIFVQGQNLYTNFKFQGWDPEVSTINDADVNSSASVSGAQYPALKTITAGINLTF